jgi:hypothetical protein
MLTDAELRSRVIPAARQRVLQDFDNRILIRELAHIYRNEIAAFRNLDISTLDDRDSSFLKSAIRNPKSKI